ncbi:MAG TPA: hypothetical protein PLF28_03730 [Agitococcus sp.]|nr:hypothetical protein [Agitococcus sp.]HMX98386.1 hypothetical protein [Agitococcus sp.]HMY28095.1 hypothetical protein [Agitococcus sp.]HMY81943.1 hypothetical protein [Agitococcus sp.]HNB19450.1 hypothetical protein [Agitococcus sp.]
MTENLNSEVFSLASQLYVRMRRSSGRVVDAIYMAQNEQYAQEILRIAGQEKDQEILEIVQRFQTLLAKTEPKIVESTPEIPVLTETIKEPTVEKTDIFSMTLRNLRRKAEVVENSPTAQPHIEELEEQVAHHYTGALR